MLGSLRAEGLKLRKRPAVWLIAAVWLVLGLVFGYLFPYLSYRGSPAGPGAGAAAPAAQTLASMLPTNLVPAAIRGFPLFAGALALILGALSAGSEYGWGTLKTILTQRPARLAVLAGKTAALAIATLLLVVATFVLDAAASLVVAAAESQSVQWPPAAELGRGMGAGWLIVTTWCLAGMLLGTLFRGTALAIGIGLVWSLAVENLVRGFASSLDVIATLDRWMPGTNAGALAASLGVPVQGKPLGAPGITDVVAGPRAALVLTGYAMAATLVAAVLLRRRDVS